MKLGKDGYRVTLINSIAIPLGKKIDPFNLKDPNDNLFDSNVFFAEGKHSGLIVAFMCNHCPYAQAIWPRLIVLSEYAKKRGIMTIAINPNIRPDYPEDQPDQMRIKIKEWEIPFPYLVDEQQDVARLFDAQCTPDIYLLDEGQKLVYHGRLDDNWQNEAKVKHQELKTAIDQYSQGLPVNPEQQPAMGCSIKWK